MPYYGGFGGPADYAQRQQEQQQQSFQQLIQMFLVLKQRQQEQSWNEREWGAKTAQQQFQNEMAKKQFEQQGSAQAWQQEQARLAQEQALGPTPAERMHGRVEAQLGGLRAAGLNLPPGIAGQRVREIQGDETFVESQAKAAAAQKRAIELERVRGEQDRLTYGQRDTGKIDPEVQFQLKSVEAEIGKLGSERNALVLAQGREWVPARKKDLVDRITAIDSDLKEKNKLRNKLRLGQKLTKEDLEAQSVVTSGIDPATDAEVKAFIVNNPEYTYNEALGILLEMRNRPKTEPTKKRMPIFGESIINK